MEIVNYEPGITQAKEECVIALGFFDGMHLGHRALLSLAKERAEALSLPLAVFTFPAEDGRIKKSAPRLYGTKKKLSLLASLGVNTVYICPLSAVSDISAEDFVCRCLVKELRAHSAVCGFNYRFGRGALGDAELLSVRMAALGRESITVPAMLHEGELLSSTAVRAHLLSAEVERAAAMLGAPYVLLGRVEGGDGRGRTLGFPTVNIPIEENSLVLPSGVYATVTYTDEGAFPSVTNVGVCPTFGTRSIHAETHLCNFSGDLYGKEVEIGFLSRLRDEKTFSSGEELVMQINIDKTRAMEVYKRWQEAGRS